MAPRRTRWGPPRPSPARAPGATRRQWQEPPRPGCPTPRKVGWGTKEGALAARRAMWVEGQDPDRVLAVYDCDCGTWHVGHPPRRDTQDTPEAG